MKNFFSQYDQKQLLPWQALYDRCIILLIFNISFKVYAFYEDMQNVSRKGSSLLLNIDFFFSSFLLLLWVQILELPCFFTV